MFHFHAYVNVSGKAHLCLSVSLLVCACVRVCVCLCVWSNQTKHVDTVRSRLFSIVEWSKISQNVAHHPLQTQMDSNGIPWIFGKRGLCFRISRISMVWQTQSSLEFLAGRSEDVIYWDVLSVSSGGWEKQQRQPPLMKRAGSGGLELSLALIQQSWSLWGLDRLKHVPHVTEVNILPLSAKCSV